MTIYLYVKTHNKTGLKYLGQTSAKDPHTYSGSGVYWKSHLKKHGYDYTTEILRECETKEEVKEFGIYYSNLWNVSESPNWANLKIEQGDGGRQNDEVRAKIGLSGKGRTPWNKGKHIWSTEDRSRISEQNRLRGPQSKETIEKRSTKNRGKTRTEEQRKRISESQKGKKLTSDHIKNLKLARQQGIKEGRIVPHNKGKTMPSSAASKFWLITYPDGKSEIIYSLKKWCFENKINYTCFHRNAKKERPYLGYKATEINN